MVRSEVYPGEQKRGDTKHVVETGNKKSVVVHEEEARDNDDFFNCAASQHSEGGADADMYDLGPENLEEDKEVTKTGA